ncbi:hypothetical protein ACFQJC_03710 [Haloferax namakaokahaiae]|uniref:Uncharacterized protein n=1 Tax=Haloferax namakaokahaiae TaxID=1748331 RepID=A0ABD5ZBQ7_9EURY
MTDTSTPDFGGRPNGPGAVKVLGEFALRVESVCFDPDGGEKNERYE